MAAEAFIIDWPKSPTSDPQTWSNYPELGVLSAIPKSASCNVESAAPIKGKCTLVMGTRYTDQVSHSSDSSDTYEARRPVYQIHQYLYRAREVNSCKVPYCICRPFVEKPMLDRACTLRSDQTARQLVPRYEELE